MDEKNSPSTELELSEILRIRREKLARLKEEGKNPFEIMTYKRTAYADQIIENFPEYEEKQVSIAGRITAWRDMGKANFLDITDSTGKIQVYLKIDTVGEEKYSELKNWDIGDICGIKGTVFRTRRGEISIKAEELLLLSKSLLPLPEKWHGLKDTDLRYRQRYVDLIVTPEVKDTFIKRSKIIKETRAFFDKLGYIEVETPVLNTISGGAAARPFLTHHNALDMDMYLRIALELHLKRLIVGGFDKVYEIGRVFRNEGMSVRHNPEFTMLEFYEAYTDYEGMMDLSENLMRTVAANVLGTTTIINNGTEIDLGKPFERLSMVDAVKKYAGIDFDEIKTREDAEKLAKEHELEFLPRHGKGDALSMLFEKYCEEKIIQPTFIMHHPVEISPLAKKIPGNPEYTERFELFIVGREFGNAFSELNDPIDQRERFTHQMELKNAGDDEASDLDEDFLNAIEYGMPPTGGMGIGMDRFIMLLTESASIRDVLLFPTMKPLKG